MREIKFRVPHFDIGTKKFKCFYYWGRIDYKGNSSKNSFASPASTSRTYAGDDQQYTGLKDKNNKEIYESDIILFHRGDKSNYYEVYWNSYHAWFSIRRKKDLDKNHHESISKEIVESCFEIVGNIYENKSLLENI